MMLATARKTMALFIILWGVSACGDGDGGNSSANVLIFSYSTGFRHDSVETGVTALTKLATRAGYEVTASEDPNIFNEDDLAPFDLIILLNNTSDRKAVDGEWWVGQRRVAFQNFVRAGKGVVVIHGAADSHYNWPWYGRMVGGYFQRHPPGAPEGTLRVVDPAHPSAEGLPEQFSRSDEWYYFQDYDPTVRLILTLDPGSIGQPDVNPNPIAWSHEYDGGRVFYTAMGHTAETYEDLTFLRHVAGGMRYALGHD
ncbi:ThuA domain-containing protein [Parvularcula sp. LCG005]|uniref:ThuA domain-containing protein n=1 Tax=Parvularcula sp. LCG005 TaxID=3078805 RepID=UPI002942E510|nr:ThuA domain-containing protein [Parvularcula sp. LCG005]WOI52672.1 ThuA domain-containing protein [Parvularcula sp. LCG005]